MSSGVHYKNIRGTICRPGFLFASRQVFFSLTCGTAYPSRKPCPCFVMLSKRSASKHLAEALLWCRQKTIPRGGIPKQQKRSATGKKKEFVSTRFLDYARNDRCVVEKLALRFVSTRFLGYARNDRGQP